LLTELNGPTVCFEPKNTIGKEKMRNVLISRLSPVPLAVTFFLASTVILFMLSCGGGGSSGPSGVTVSGSVDDGTANSPIPNARCSYRDLEGIFLNSVNADDYGNFSFTVDPEKEGYIQCYPPDLEELTLSTYLSTMDQAGGNRISGVNVTPETTIVSDLIRAGNPNNKQIRKIELDAQMETDADYQLVSVLSSQLYKQMWKQNINTRFGTGGGGEGGGSGGGVGGGAGDGAASSPIADAKCEFIAGSDLTSSAVLYSPALSDFLDNGELDRSDLWRLVNNIPELQQYTPQQIKNAFENVFEDNIGTPCVATTDENGDFFIENVPNVSGYIRCIPPDKPDLILATYVPAVDEGGDRFAGQVDPRTTYFSNVIGPGLNDEDVESAWDNYENETSEMIDQDIQIVKEGDTITGFELHPEVDPEASPIANKDTTLVAFSAASLFNVLYKNNENVDYLEALNLLVEKKEVDASSLRQIGVSSEKTAAYVQVANTSNTSAEEKLQTTLSSALSKARIIVTVTDSSGGSAISGASVDVSGATNDGPKTTNTNGRAVLNITGIASDSETVTLEISGVAGYVPVEKSVRISASASVDVEVVLTGDTTLCSYTVSPAGRTVASTVGDSSFTITASFTNCKWSASSDVGWITITSGQNGSGNGTVGYSVAENSGGERTGYINAGGKRHTVTQAGVDPCTYTVSPANHTIASAGGDSSFTVTASRTDCSWNASSSVDWITIISGQNGSGNGTVGYSVSENSGNERTGNINIADTTILVKQEGKQDECNVTVPIQTKPANNATIAGTSVSIEWTVGSGDSWPLQVKTSSGESIFNSTVTGDTVYKISDLEKGTTYQWRVAAAMQGTDCVSEWSAWRSFTIQDEPELNITDPENNVVWNEGSNQWIRWNKNDAATGNVKIEYSMGGSWLEINDNVGGDQYYWQVPYVSSDMTGQIRVTALEHPEAYDLIKKSGQISIPANR
jgi:hypothetical protein